MILYVNLIDQKYRQPRLLFLTEERLSSCRAILYHSVICKWRSNHPVLSTIFRKTRIEAGMLLYIPLYASQYRILN